MATRPVFIPSMTNDFLVETKLVDFVWSPGMAKSQHQKSITSLHAGARKELRLEKILEISSKSPDEVGDKLSAFNLMIRAKEKEYSVECAYQASKVFEHGGPFLELLEGRSIDAKRDPRLKESGCLTGFKFYNYEWGLEPKSAFYDWLYINAVHQNQELAKQLVQYEAFTDIAYNPIRKIKKSKGKKPKEERFLACQAYAAALYVSLYKRGKLDGNRIEKKRYLEVINGFRISSAHENTAISGSQQSLPI